MEEATIEPASASDPEWCADLCFSVCLDAKPGEQFLGLYGIGARSRRRKVLAVEATTVLRAAAWNSGMGSACGVYIDSNAPVENIKIQTREVPSRCSTLQFSCKAPYSDDGPNTRARRADLSAHCQLQLLVRRLPGALWSAHAHDQGGMVHTAESPRFRSRHAGCRALLPQPQGQQAATGARSSMTTRRMFGCLPQDTTRLRQQRVR